MNKHGQTWLSLTAQWLSAVSAVLFGGAVAMNTWVFSRWGLNFLQLATPSDVVASGLQLATALFAPTLGLVVGWAVGRLAVWDRVHPKLSVILVSLPAFAVGTLMMKRMYIDNLDPGAYAFVFTFTYGLWLSRWAAVGALASFSVWLVAATLACCCIVSGLFQVMIVAARGFPERFVEVQANGACVGQLLWSGEKAVVALCPDKKIIVHYAPENMTMKVQPEKRLSTTKALPPNLPFLPRVVPSSWASKWWAGLPWNRLRPAHDQGRDRQAAG